MSGATPAFAILIFYLSQPLTFWVCSCFVSLQPYFGCPSELEKDIKVLGKRLDNVQVGQALLHFSSCWGEAAGNSSPPSDEEAEAWGSFKVHITRNSPPKWGGCQRCLDTQLPNAANSSSLRKRINLPRMPNASDNHTRTANSATLHTHYHHSSF